MTNLLAVLAATASLAGAHAPSAAERSAEVRFTQYGVAHVKAEDFEGVGYGYGWAFARDNLCLAADSAITLAGERSLRLGAETTYLDPFANLETGLVLANLDSDVFYRAHLGPSAVEAARRYASADLRGLVRGYARGFNRHVREGALAGETCRSETWFRPLTEEDVWRRLLDIPILETSNQLLQQIVRASPASGAVAALSPAAHAGEPMGAASNAAAFGKAMTGGGGLSFSNPHFPWSGIERLHALHLTVPGRYDVFGATLYGIPVPMMGFSARVGWSITYDTDQHTTAYQLKLDPSSPTRYLVDGRSLPMERVQVEVPVKGAPNASVRRTLWRTRYGFVFSLPGLEWTRSTAYALADPETANVRMGDGFLDVGRAGDVHAIKASLDRHMAMPWSNVTAADASGEALYANIALTPDLDAAKLARCKADVALPPHLPKIARVLRGWDSSCAWTQDPAAVQPGTVPPARRPSLIRDDFVFNSNDSHWLATWDADATLDGFAPTIGDERTLRGERTRMAVMMARARRDATDGLGRRGIDAGRWEALFFRSRNLMAELLLDDLLADCRADPVVDLGPPGGRVDLAPACDILSRWDRTDRLDSRGSILFREFLVGLERLDETGFKLAERYWRVPFSPTDPVGTPTGLRTSAETRAALAKAVTRLKAADVALDAPLREIQFAAAGGLRLPISGSSFSYNVARAAVLPGVAGLAPVASGDSYMHVVALSPKGPAGRFIVTYSQSTNPRSPHASDMTALFSKQSLADAPYTDAEINANSQEKVVRLVY